MGPCQWRPVIFLVPVLHVILALNLLVIPSRANPVSGIDLTTSSEIAECQIQTTEISIFVIHENISVIHQNKAYKPLATSNPVSGSVIIASSSLPYHNATFPIHENRK